MTITLPDLPYDKTALEPHISAETLDFHHGKHHNTYVVNLNKLLEGRQDLSSQSLEDIILASADKSVENIGVFNNSAQIWNHSFYWHCLSPNGGGEPVGAISTAITRDFGSYENFKQQFTQASLTQFGSGWAWLVSDDNGKLSIIKTANADTPLTDPNLKPILTCDVWEHAYYVDYRNRRPDYVATFLDKLVNWEFANSNYCS
jgi:Fe-Mn family superoxide dismutase